MLKVFFAKLDLFTAGLGVFQQMKFLRIKGYGSAIVVGLSLSLMSSLSQAEESLPTLEAQAETFQKGWQAAHDGELDKAYEIWESLSKENITVPELSRAVQNNLAVLLIKKKEYGQAQEKLDSALKADVQVATTLANLNQIYSYQAQQAYKKVFSGATVVWPQGEFLFFDIEKSNLPTESVVTEMPEYSGNGAQQTKATLQVKGLLASWREAWAGQNVEAYLSFYDQNEFIPKFGGSFENWKKGRYRSLTRPEYIKIEIEDIQIVQLDKNLVRSKFLQKYESDRFKDGTYKVILWQLFDRQWKIVQEVVIHEES